MYADNTAIMKEYWGNQLSAYEYKIYSAIHEYAVNGGKGEMNIEFVYDGIWDHGEEWLQEKVSDMVARAESAFCFDYPLYWCKNFDYDMHATGNRISIHLQAVPYYEHFWDEIPEVQDGIHVLEKEIRQQNQTEDSFLLLESIYVAVADSLEYSFRTDEICGESSYDDGIVHTIAAAVKEEYHHRGVCSAYSGLFQIICNDFGIPCIQVTNSLENSESHSFNLVCLEGEWYLVDVTWADMNDQIDWRYFLAGSKVVIKEHELGGQLACPMVVTPFANETLADTYFYEWKNGVLQWELPENIVYDGNDPEAEDTFVITAYTDPPSRAVADNLEFTFENGRVVDADTPGEVSIDVTHSGFVKVKAVGRYVKDQLEHKLYIKSYPEFESMETGWLVRCKDNRFMTKGILAETAEYYDITTEKIPYILSFARNTLEHMDKEQIFDCSLALFTGFEEKDYVEGIREEIESENINHKDFIQKVVKKQLRREEKKYSKGDMVFGLAFAQYEPLYQEGVLTYHLPEQLQAYRGRSLIGYTTDEKGNVVEIGVFEISSEGDMIVIAPYETMFFYEEPWKTIEEYYRPFLIIGVSAVIFLFAGLLMVRFRRKNQDDFDGIEW